MKQTNFKRLLSVLALLIPLSLFGQTQAFKVLGVKGEATLNGKPLQVGTSILSNQTLIVGTGAYLGLAHASNKTLEITKAGSYKVSDLESKLQENGGLASRYAQYVISELTNDDANGSRFHSKAKTGSVTRALGSSAITFLMPIDENGVSKATKVLDKTQVVIRWALTDPKLPQPANYRFVVRDGSPDKLGTILYETTTTSPKVVLDLTQEKLDKSRILLYQVEAVIKDERVKSEELAITKLKVRDAQIIQSELAELPKEKTALNCLIQARYFEDKGLIANAMSSYEEAIQLQPTSEYQHYYQLFLDGYHLSEPNHKEVSVGKAY